MQGLWCFVAVFVEYLSEGLDVQSSGIDAQYHRLRYVTLVCKYEFENAENEYFSENDNRPRPRRRFIPAKKDHVLNIE